MNRFIKIVLSLILFVTICGYAYTGEYCFGEACLQINHDGKALFVIGDSKNKISITASYTKTDSIFSVIPQAAANTETKNFIVNALKEFNNATISDNIRASCKRAAERGEIYNDKIYPSTDNGRELCRRDTEQSPNIKRARQEINNLKYSNDNFKEFLEFCKTANILFRTNLYTWINSNLNLILVENTLYKTYGSLRPSCTSKLIKSGTAEVGNKHFCAGNAIHNKCGGKAYNPTRKDLKCENNILLAECTNKSQYNVEDQFCSCSIVGNYGCKNYMLKDYGKFTDSRDGNTYKTIVIGKQTWMAQNLDYNGKDGKLGLCYGNASANCITYGRLYSWEQAKIACPEGWHLPSDKEWASIMSGGFASEHMALNDWPNEGKPSNESGFSAIPSGYGSSGRFNELGFLTAWWSTKERSASEAVAWGIYDAASRNEFIQNKLDLFSVRCVRESAPSDSECNFTLSKAGEKEPQVLYDNLETKSSLENLKAGIDLRKQAIAEAKTMEMPVIAIGSAKVARGETANTENAQKSAERALTSRPKQYEIKVLATKTMRYGSNSTLYTYVIVGIIETNCTQPETSSEL